MKNKNDIKFLIFLLLLLIPILVAATFGPWIGLREQATTPVSSTNGGKIFVNSSNQLCYLTENGSVISLSVTDPNISLSDPTTIGTLSLGSASITDSSGAISFGDETLTVGTVNFSEYLYHDGDADTAIRMEADRIRALAGARTMIDAYETTQDYLYLGYDGSNDIDVSIGTNACLFVEGSSEKVKITDIIQFPFSTADVTCDETMEMVYDDAEDQFVFYDANNGELVSEEFAITGIKHLSLVCDPGSWYDSDTELFIMTLGDDAPSGIIIDEWKLSCNVDPDTEIDADLRYADDWVTLANAADIDVIDTTNGTSSEDTDANINGGAAVANGKVIYIGFDADPEGTCTQMIFEMWFHAID